MEVSGFIAIYYFNWQKIWAHYQLPLCTRGICPLFEPLLIRKMRKAVDFWLWYPGIGMKGAVIVGGRKQYRIRLRGRLSTKQEGAP